MTTEAKTTAPAVTEANRAAAAVAGATGAAAAVAEANRADPETDVIVVGAGPTGLLLAGELGLAGVRAVVLERLPAPTGQSRALNLQPRSAEILDSRGLLEPLLDRAVDRIPAGHFAGLPVPLDYGALDTRHPYQIGIPQARVEAFLEERLDGLGVPVRRGHALTGLAQDADGVTATVTGPDGPGRLRGRYLVGCDGGRSTVRKLLGVPFPGRDGRMSAVVADVVLSAPAGVAPDRWRLPSLESRAGRVATLLPLSDGAYRLLFAGPEQQALDRDTPVGAAEVGRALLAAYGPEVELTEIRWASRFTDASRQVERYRTGRVLLAGDAAHIHSPTGGQGMNLGLQDAANLGWKLAAEVAGWAPAHLLDTYHDERHPVAARVLASTRAQGVLAVPDEDVRALRGVFDELLALPGANRHLAGLVSGLDLRYDVPGADAHPLLGCRMPDLDLATAAGSTRVSRLLHAGRGLLLEFADRPRLAAGPMPRVAHHSGRPDRDVGVGAVLVRPDGYVCWADPRPACSSPTTPSPVTPSSPTPSPTTRPGRPPSLDAALRHWFGLDG